MHIPGQNQCHSMLWGGWDWGFFIKNAQKSFWFFAHIWQKIQKSEVIWVKEIHLSIFSFFQMPMFLNFLPIISIKLKFMQCAIMAFFKARLWWCFVILWRLFKSYWTFVLTKSCLTYVTNYLLSKYQYLIPSTLRKLLKNLSDTYGQPCMNASKVKMSL